MWLPWLLQEGDSGNILVSGALTSTSLGLVFSHTTGSRCQMASKQPQQGCIMYLDSIAGVYQLTLETEKL